MTTEPAASGVVVAVSLDADHRFSKAVRERIRLLAGLGVEGDAHVGVTVQHRSRVRKDPTQPNLRQVHLLHEELFAELRAEGFELAPGLIGENITTRGIDLLTLPQGTRLHIGADAIIGVTGLRDPCRQLNDFRSGLMAAVLETDEQGNVVRKAGIMGVVLAAGDVRAGDAIRVELPPEPRQPLERV
ncbi:MAG TPA: MOSC domain-containing protein [Pseudolabrys sp.]|jgi:MOSC domain-containing protein YiiM|nr:MOSC domain-containing protein [Pseudolabrys sp.]